MEERMYIFVLGVKVSGYEAYTSTVCSMGVTIDNAFNNKYLNTDEPLAENVVILNAYYVSRGELVKVV